MRFDFNNFSSPIKPIIDKEEFPLIASSNGGWERWFQLEYEYYLYKHLLDYGISNITVESEVNIYFDCKCKVDLYLVSGYDKYVLEFKCQTFQTTVKSFTKNRVIREDMTKFNVTFAQGVKYLAIMYVHWVSDNEPYPNTDDTPNYLKEIKEAFIEEGYNEKKIDNALNGKICVQHYGANQLSLKGYKLRSVCFVMLSYDEIKHGFALY